MLKDLLRMNLMSLTSIPEDVSDEMCEYIALVSSDSEDINEVCDVVASLIPSITTSREMLRNCVASSLAGKEVELKSDNSLRSHISSKETKNDAPPAVSNVVHHTEEQLDTKLTDAEIIADDGQWSCSSCTYFNDSSRSSCDMCGHSKILWRDKSLNAAAECKPAFMRRDVRPLSRPPGPSTSSAKAGSNNILCTQSILTVTTPAADRRPATASPATVKPEPLAAVTFLQSLQPGLSNDCLHAVLVKFGGNKELAAHFLLDHECEEVARVLAAEKAAREEAEREATRQEEKEKRILRDSVLKRFGEHIVDDNYSTFHRPDALVKKEMGWDKTRKEKRSEKRYRDDLVVTSKGEKFIVEKTKEEDPATFISIKIKTKRKGGKGFR